MADSDTPVANSLPNDQPDPPADQGGQPLYPGFHGPWVDAERARQRSSSPGSPANLGTDPTSSLAANVGPREPADLGNLPTAEQGASSQGGSGGSIFQDRFGGRGDTGNGSSEASSSSPVGNGELSVNSEDATFLQLTRDPLFREMAANALTFRQEWFRKMGDPRRNIDDECGYNAGVPNPEELWLLYLREAIAARVVECVPKESWQVQPKVYETEDPDDYTDLEQVWDSLGGQLRGEWSHYREQEGSPIWEYLRRVDILSGLGEYAALLLGLDDGRPLSSPAEGMDEIASGLAQGTGPSSAMYGSSGYFNDDGPYGGYYQPARGVTTPYEMGWTVGGTAPAGIPSPNGGETSPGVRGGNGATPDKPKKPLRKLLYLRVFPQHLAQITQFESNPASPRNGQPVMYNLTMNDPRNASAGGSLGLTTSTIAVHWTRVIHVADNLFQSEVFGIPRMVPVLRRLRDLEKLYGGSAEMYWRGAFPGYSLETHPQLGGNVRINEAKIKDMMEQWSNGLQRYLHLMGMSAKSLAPQVVDPSTQIDVQITAICIQLGIPKRIFMGSERGELASSQDDQAWNDRLRARQRDYMTPRIIVPFVDRLIACGVLPPPGGSRFKVDQGPTPGAMRKAGSLSAPADVPATVPSVNAPFGGGGFPKAPSPFPSKPPGAPGGTPPPAAGGPSGTPPADRAPPAPKAEQDPKKHVNPDTPDHRAPGAMQGPPSYTVFWPDLTSQSQEEKATVGLTRTQALVAWSGAGGDASGITKLDFFTGFLGFTEDEAQSYVDNAKDAEDTAAVEEAALADQQAHEESLKPPPVIDPATGLPVPTVPGQSPTVPGQPPKPGQPATAAVALPPGTAVVAPKPPTGSVPSKPKVPGTSTPPTALTTHVDTVLGMDGQLLDSLFSWYTLNWCNQHGGDTCGVAEKPPAAGKGTPATNPGQAPAPPQATNPGSAPAPGQPPAAPASIALRIKQLAGKAVEMANSIAQAAILKLGPLAPDILDTADDFSRIYYAGGAGKSVASPLASVGVGIGAGPLTVIASHVLGRAAVFIKHKLAGNELVEMYDIVANARDVLASVGNAGPEDSYEVTNGVIYVLGLLHKEIPELGDLPDREEVEKFVNERLDKHQAIDDETPHGSTPPDEPPPGPDEPGTGGGPMDGEATAIPIGLPEGAVSKEQLVGNAEMDWPSDVIATWDRDMTYTTDDGEVSWDWDWDELTQNWCNKYGGTTCKDGRGFTATQKPPTPPQAKTQSPPKEKGPGKTGEFKDSAGRRICYESGKKVKCPPLEKPAKTKPPSQKPPAKTAGTKGLQPPPPPSSQPQQPPTSPAKTAPPPPEIPSNVTLSEKAGGITRDGKVIGHEVAAVVKELGYTGSVKVHDTVGWGFNLNGKELRAGADYHPTTKEINLYGPGWQSNIGLFVRGGIAHEIQHAKYSKVMDAFDNDSSKSSKFPPEAFDNRSMLKPAYTAQAPTLARLDGLLGDKSALRRDDGVTDYSKDWWAQHRAGKCSMDTAVNETLAEVANLRMQGKSSGSATYDRIYDVMHDEYKAITTGSKRTKIHDSDMVANIIGLIRNSTPPSPPLGDDYEVPGDTSYPRERPVTPAITWLDSNGNPVDDPDKASYLSWWNADGSHGRATVIQDTEPTDTKPAAPEDGGTNRPFDQGRPGNVTGNEGNCGTGAGGFQPGNTCGSSAGGGASASGSRMPLASAGSVKQVVDSVARDLGYTGHIEVHDKEGWTVEVGDKKGAAAADYDPNTGRINVYGGSLSMSGSQHIREVIAHEVQHARYKTVMDQFHKDVESSNDLPPEAFNRHGMLRPEYHDKYPTLSRLDPLLSDREKLRSEDGVTDYSKAWWSQQRSGKCDTDTAVNETLAEVASLRMRGQESKSGHYNKIHDIINDEYNAIANGAKRTWVHDNWLAFNAKEDRRNTMDDVILGATADPNEYPRLRGRKPAEVYVDENMNPVDDPSKATYVSRWTDDGRHVWAKIGPAAG